jgi:RNA 2',3'-cyclic 3'-phosphodiesterase
MRTFIAIEFPTPIQQTLDQRSQALQGYLRAQNAPHCLRWASAENAHLTLRFLGETTNEQAQALATGLHALAAAHLPFALTLGPVGGFPNLRQPRVLWLGISGELAKLHALQAAIEQQVQCVGFAAEYRPFSPHITLARAKREAEREQLHRIGQLVAAYRETATTVSWDVTSFVHMQSELHPTGAVYRSLARLHLGSQSQL